MKSNGWGFFDLHYLILFLLIGDLTISLGEKIIKLLGRFFNHYLGFIWNPYPKESRLVRFVCTHKDTLSANEVLVSGEFNGWLHARESSIYPARWEVKRYGLKKKKVGRRVFWEGEIRIPLGTHNFKFVANRNHWISWYKQSDHLKGNQAPGGLNFKIKVLKERVTKVKQ